jgi:hypothetical protein
MAFRGLAPELLEPWVTRVFYQTYSMQSTMYTELFNEESSSKAFEDFFAMAGLGQFALKPEGVPVTYDDPVQGDRRRIPILTFALGVRFTMEMLQDDQHGMVPKLAGDLGRAARHSQETLAWGLVNDAAAGNTYLGYPEGDGALRELWSTGHVFLKNPANTYSNRLNPGVALSTAGLESALTMFTTAQGEEEHYINVTPRTLVIHPDNQHLAAQLLDSTQEVGTSDNQINSVARSRSGLGVVNNGKGVPYLTDTDAWSLWASKGEHSVTWFNRQSLDTKTGDDSQTFDKFTIAYYRAAVVGSVP